MPSLDVGDQSRFERVNRPHRGISFEQVVDGLVTFATGFRGKIWLEVFVLRGISDQTDEIARIAAIAARVRPERVQLNTVSRPPAEDHVLAAPLALLERLCGQFAGPCEVIAEHRLVESSGRVADRDVEQEIVALLNRRPCTVEGISDGLGLLPNEVIKHLDVLVTRGTVHAARRDNGVFYEGVRH